MADDPLDFSDRYNTPLGDALSPDYMKFLQKYPIGSTYDYDMQGFHAANPDAEMSPGQHFPDTFKKPNHPTFSDQSQYHGRDGNEGGSWELLGSNKFAFTPGRTNLEHHSTQELLDYFKKHEPNSRLVLPGY